MGPVINVWKEEKPHHVLHTVKMSPPTHSFFFGNKKKKDVLVKKEPNGTHSANPSGGKIVKGFSENLRKVKRKIELSADSKLKCSVKLFLKNGRNFSHGLGTTNQNGLCPELDKRPQKGQTFRMFSKKILPALINEIEWNQMKYIEYGFMKIHH